MQYSRILTLGCRNLFFAFLFFLQGSYWGANMALRQLKSGAPSPKKEVY